jgi:5-hydroxyisourate hydrolase
MSGISTHVLDVAAGKPASGIRVRLYSEGAEVGSCVTNQDGRCTNLLPANGPLRPGTYKLTFDVGARFADCFYPEIEISFRISDATTHYHIPLLLSPFGYTTYRGS